MTRGSAFLFGTSTRRFILSLGVGIVAAAIWFGLTARLGIEPADEGYFWYGAQRTALGEVAMRDFKSYDVGRYAYVAAFLRLLHDDGILAARVAAYSLIAVLVALAAYLVLDCAARRADSAARTVLSLVAVVMLTVIWVYPYYKIFEMTAALLLLWAVYLVLLRRSTAAWFALGAVTGFVAVTGRNHGVYGVVASLCACAIVFMKAPRIRPTSRDFLMWSAGVCIGYAPVLWMLAFTPGFSSAFIETIVLQIRGGTTNIGLPVPWPWLGERIDLAHGGFVYGLHPIALGCGFLVLLVFPIWAFVRLVRARSIDVPSAAPAAALCVAIPYAQYAFSRADLVHLVPAMMPVIVGTLMGLEIRRLPLRVATLIAVFGFSLLALYDSPPVHFFLNRQEQWEAIDVGGDRLLAEPLAARQWRHPESELQRWGPGRSFLAIPNMITLHAAHRQRMAVLDIYPLSAIGPAGEAEEIARIAAERPAIILLSERPYDPNPALRFSVLQPLMYDWITRHYDRVPSSDPTNTDRLEVYKAR